MPAPSKVAFATRYGSASLITGASDGIGRAIADLAQFRRGGTVWPTTTDKILQGSLVLLPRRWRTDILSCAMTGMVRAF
ncbi:MAG: hypothetical protein AAGE03_04655 [Pseudomonadota bacterium]